MLGILRQILDSLLPKVSFFPILLNIEEGFD